MSVHAYANFLVDDHYTTKTTEYTFQEVCRALTLRDAPLIEGEGSVLDCMGTKVKPIDFCLKREVTNPYITRAVISDRKILCKSASRVILKWKCEGETDRYCKDKDVGCFLFKEVLARRLKLAHHSLQNGELNCYFDTQVNDIQFND